MELTKGNYTAEVQVQDNVGNSQSTLVGFIVNITPSPLPEETEPEPATPEPTEPEPTEPRANIWGGSWI